MKIYNCKKARSAAFRIVIVITAQRQTERAYKSFFFTATSKKGLPERTVLNMRNHKIT
jgi:hypothetical protein